jgi:hypothetical protein
MGDMRRSERGLRRESIDLKSVGCLLLMVFARLAAASLQYRFGAGQCNIAPAF